MMGLDFFLKDMVDKLKGLVEKVSFFCVEKCFGILGKVDVVKIEVGQYFDNFKEKLEGLLLSVLCDNIKEIFWCEVWYIVNICKCYNSDVNRDEIVVK